MAKDKERSVNPAAAQRKQDKQKSLKKGKAEAQARRNEKLARRNPERIQRQINDFKAMEEAGEKLRPRDKEILEALEKDLRGVLKAREALGEKAPKFSGGHGPRRDGDAVLGKRRRDEEHGRYPHESDSSDTDEDVRRIPMPRDTPPPIPRQPRRQAPRDNEDSERRGPHALPSRPPAVEHKTVYEAKPEIRDLRQEAVNKFIPAAVRMKQDSIRGTGKLLEPEEMDRLEKAGYNATASAGQPSVTGDEQLSLEEEERRFRQEMKQVQIEEVEDEEA
jgi:WW domain binding protein 11.